MIRIIRTKNAIHNCVIVFWTVLLFFIVCIPAKISAQVLINEVSPASSPEWVEIINNSSDTVYFQDYSINFGSDSQNLFFCANDSISGGGFKLIHLTSSWLANTGDKVSLKKGDDEIDSIGYGTGYALPKPGGASETITRSPDGSSNWILTSQISPQGDIISFDCPTPFSTPSPAPTEASSYKAVYKINLSKSQNGETLSGVQIFVDGTYIHHEDDETIYFYNGHECYAEVHCDLGNHTVSLRKSGYNSWEDTQNFKAGDNFEVSPLLSKIQTTAPTFSPLPTITPKPTINNYKTASISAELASTASGDIKTPMILGIGSKLSLEDNVVDQNKSKTNLIFPAIVILIGMGFIGYSIFSIIRNVKKKDPEIS